MSGAGRLLSLGAALALAACAGSGASKQAGGAIALPDVSGRPAIPSLVVFATVSGMTPDLYRGPAPTMPTLAALAAGGVSADVVRGVAPASTYPAHATLVTGRQPAEHGISADLLLGDHGVRFARYSHASRLESRTLWQAAVEAKRGVATLAWPSTIGAEIPMLLPDVVPTRRGQHWIDALAGAGTPAVIELARSVGGASPEANTEGPARDAAIVGVACALLGSSQPPSLLLLRLSQTAPALASSGPGSPEARAAFSSADAQLARLVGCLRDARWLPGSVVAVAGDHGTVPVHTVVNPNGVLARERLVFRGNGTGPEISEWTAIARSNGGSAFVYAKDGDAALRARRALSAEAKRTGTFRIVSAEEMLGLGADPEAWFGLEAEPGYAFGDGASTPVSRPAARRAAGGYLPTQPEMDTGFVAWGRGLRSGIRIPTMRQIDVAPTLARLLSLDLGDTDGRALVGALRLDFVRQSD